MGVRPQTWNQLREGELLTCDSCFRLLYWDPSMAPAPDPDAKPKPKAKRKVVKDEDERLEPPRYSCYPFLRRSSPRSQPCSAFASIWMR